MSNRHPNENTVIERNVPIPMRDGTLLSGDVYRPKADGRYPVIVNRHCYHSEMAMQKMDEDGTFFSRHGYVYLFSNVRGTFASGGEFVPGIDDAAFQPFAQAAKENCPLSKVLSAAEITLVAKMTGAK